MEGPLLDILAKLADIADRLGALALALAGIFGFATGRVVLGSRVAEDHADAARERSEQDAEHQRQIEWLEARRKEERDDRIAAETAMRNLIDKLDSVTSLVSGLKEEVIRGSSRRA